MTDAYDTQADPVAQATTSKLNPRAPPFLLGARLHPPVRSADEHPFTTGLEGTSPSPNAFADLLRPENQYMYSASFNPNTAMNYQPAIREDVMYMPPNVVDGYGGTGSRDPFSVQLHEVEMGKLRFTDPQIDGYARPDNHDHNPFVVDDDNSRAGYRSSPRVTKGFGATTYAYGIGQDDTRHPVMAFPGPASESIYVTASPNATDWPHIPFENQQLQHRGIDFSGHQRNSHLRKKKNKKSKKIYGEWKNEDKIAREENKPYGNPKRGKTGSKKGGDGNWQLSHHVEMNQQAW